MHSGKNLISCGGIEILRKTNKYSHIHNNSRRAKSDTSVRNAFSLNLEKLEDEGSPFHSHDPMNAVEPEERRSTQGRQVEHSLTTNQSQSTQY